MQFRALSEEDWQIFLDWSGQEGWRVSFQEQRLFQGQWRPSFFAMYAGGQLRGFVSAVAYRQSGWIGNLLVPAEQRGYGYGSALFDYALRFLQQAKLSRIWLTASELGLPIYQRRGFRVVDQVDRWLSKGKESAGCSPSKPVAEFVDLDTQCWGESRSPLLNALSDDGDILRCGNTWGLLQPGLSSWQLGPWLSVDKNVTENRQLLELAVKKTVRGKELVIDALESADIDFVLYTSGFQKASSNRLMVLSEHAISLQGVMALASLGSIG